MRANKRPQGPRGCRWRGLQLKISPQQSGVWRPSLFSQPMCIVGTRRIVHRWFIERTCCKTAAHFAKYSDQVELLKQGGGEAKKGRHREERMSDEMSRVRPPLSSCAPWSLAPWEPAVWIKPLMEGAGGAAADGAHPTSESTTYPQEEEQEPER